MYSSPSSSKMLLEAGDVEEEELSGERDLMMQLVD
jgi:hypothetical protein